MSSIVSGTSILPPRKKSAAEIGWISHSTYQELPARFQASARELASKGELVIEGIPIAPGVQKPRYSQDSE